MGWDGMGWGGVVVVNLYLQKSAQFQSVPARVGAGAGGISSTCIEAAIDDDARVRTPPDAGMKAMKQAEKPEDQSGFANNNINYYHHRIIILIIIHFSVGIEIEHRVEKLFYILARLKLPFLLFRHFGISKVTKRRTPIPQPIIRSTEISSRMVASSSK